jgi:hypothetical protein
MGAFSGPNVLADDRRIVFALDAGNAKCYSGVGSIVYDMTAINDMTLYNSVGYTSGAIPYFSFNGTNQYMRKVSGVINPLTSNNATVIAWIQPDSSAGNDPTYNGLFSLGTKGCGLGSGNGQTLLFSIRSNRTLTMAKWCDDSYSSLTVPDNSWSMVSLKKQGSLTRFSVNETFQTTGNTGTQNFAGTSFTVGCTDNPGRFYRGKMNSISLYNAALTDQEILNIFNATRNRFGI